MQQGEAVERARRNLYFGAIPQLIYLQLIQFPLEERHIRCALLPAQHVVGQLPCDVVVRLHVLVGPEQAVPVQRIEYLGLGDNAMFAPLSFERQAAPAQSGTLAR